MFHGKNHMSFLLLHVFNTLLCHNKITLCNSITTICHRWIRVNYVVQSIACNENSIVSAAYIEKEVRVSCVSAGGGKWSRCA